MPWRWPAAAANEIVTAPLGDISVDRFLAEFWQKRPLLIRQAFPGIQPDIDGDDLAGLACEPLAEARIVSGSYPEHNWALQHGPFDEEVFTQLPATNWRSFV